jgi:2'-hydroxyisoflavone reductase
MKLLIIGGTKFWGRHLAAAALARGHEVTLFNRGKHSPESIDNIEQIQGDRHRDLDKLGGGRRWHAVIDTCGYLPPSVRASAGALKDSVDRYVFISSISAYADYSNPNFDETAPLAQLTEEQSARAKAIDPAGDVTAATLEEMYGALKALCEQEAEKALPDKTLIIRPGLIVGSFDPTDRFTYWVMRVARGGEVLAPGSPDRFVQLIDARDLSEWTVKMIETESRGVFNATGRPFELTMEKMLGEMKTIAGSDASFTFVSEEFLDCEKVVQWSEMPLYLSESREEIKGFLSVNIDKALQANLTFRPLSETIRDVLDWRKTRAGELKAGIDSERERELLAKWREQ